MPLDQTFDDLEADCQILEAIDRHIDHLIDGLLSGGAIQKALRRWLTGHGKTAGFDLVAVKHSVIDEEVDRLGLDFTTRATTSRRYVHGDSYDAGKAAGAHFEPSAAVSG